MKDPAALENACEQALLLLERARFADDDEAKVVRAVLKGALKDTEGWPEPAPLPTETFPTATVTDDWETAE